jgi:hypothetical protein
MIDYSTHSPQRNTALPCCQSADVGICWKNRDVARRAGLTDPHLAWKGEGETPALPASCGLANGEGEGDGVTLAAWRRASMAA